VTAQSATAPTTGKVPLRSAFSLTTGESLFAFAVGLVTWLLLPIVRYGSGRETEPSAWLAFALCNALALCAVCTYRTVKRVPTRSISQEGYLILALPLVQAVALGVFQCSKDFDILCGLWLLFSFLPHLVASASTFPKAFRPTRNGTYTCGDAVALPLSLG